MLPGVRAALARYQGETFRGLVSVLDTSHPDPPIRPTSIIGFLLRAGTLRVSAPRVPGFSVRRHLRIGVYFNIDVVASRGNRTAAARVAAVEVQRIQALGSALADMSERRQ